MGVSPEVDDEYSIVGGSREFAMASGIVRRALHMKDAKTKTEVDRLTIQGLIPILGETVNAIVSVCVYIYTHVLFYLLNVVVYSKLIAKLARSTEQFFSS